MFGPSDARPYRGGRPPAAAANDMLDVVWSHPAFANRCAFARNDEELVCVNLAGGRLVRPGHVWADPESDVAVLRLDGLSNLPTVTLGDSDSARVGQGVLAIGSPVIVHRFFPVTMTNAAEPQCGARFQRAARLPRAPAGTDV